VDNLWTAAQWVGRVGFVALFVISGIAHFTNFNGVTAYAQSKHVPFAAVAVAVTGLMQLAASAMILLHWHVIWACGLLVVFLVPVALYIHNFWTESDPMAAANQKAHFWKNISLASAAILYAVWIHA